MPTIVLALGFWIATSFPQSAFGWGIIVENGIYFCLLVLIATWLVHGSEYLASRVLISITLFIVLSTRQIWFLGRGWLYYHIGLMGLSACVFPVFELLLLRFVCQLRMNDSKALSPSRDANKFTLRFLFLTTVCVAITTIALKNTWPEFAPRTNDFVAHTSVGIATTTGMTSLLSIPCFYVAFRSSKLLHIIWGLCLFGVLGLTWQSIVYLTIRATRGMPKKNENFWPDLLSPFVLSFIFSLLIVLLWYRAVGYTMKFSGESFST